jgi:hypothetical protein
MPDSKWVGLEPWVRTACMGGALLLRPGRFRGP